MGDLQERFESFLMAIGAVSLDTCEWDKKFEGLNRPDYFLAQQNIVFEIKRITNSPEYKAIEEIDRHRNRPEFPLFYGSVSIQSILSHLPDGDEINKRIYNRVTKQLDGYLHHSNKQLREAKKVLSGGLAGVLVVLNDAVDILDPTIVAHRVATRLRMKNRNAPFYPSVDFVLIFDERNVMVGRNGDRTFACISIEGNNVAAFPEQGRYVDHLQVAWAKFNKAHLFKANTNLADFGKEGIEKQNVRPLKDRMKRYELWEQIYLRDRYLRTLSDDDLLKYGARLMKAIEPHITKDSGDRAGSHEALVEVTQGWQHFLTEAKLRALPLNRLREYFGSVDVLSPTKESSC